MNNLFWNDAEKTQPDSRRDVLVEVELDDIEHNYTVIAIGNYKKRYSHRARGKGILNEEYCQEKGDYYFKAGWYLKSYDGLGFADRVTNNTITHWADLSNRKLLINKPEVYANRRMQTPRLQ